jgi:hypothetical protein
VKTMTREYPCCRYHAPGSAFKDACTERDFIRKIHRQARMDVLSLSQKMDKIDSFCERHAPLIFVIYIAALFTVPIWVAQIIGR